MRFLKRLSARFQLKRVNHQIFLLSIFTITIPLLAMSGIAYGFMMQSMKKEYQDSASLILNHLSFNIDQYLQSIEKGTVSAQLDEQLQSSLQRWGSDASAADMNQTLQYRNVIENFVSMIEMTIKNVDSVRIYAGDRIFYSMNFNQADYEEIDFKEEEWYQAALAGEGKATLIGAHLPFNRVNATEPVISIARVINKTGTRDPLGVILVDIRLDSLREILSLSENRNRNFLIVDDRGVIVYSSQQERQQEQQTPLVLPITRTPELQSVMQRDTGSFYADLSGKPSYVNFVTSHYSGWKVIQYIEELEMTKDAKLFRKLMLAFAFCSLGAALLFLLILSARVTKPIIYLSSQVRAVGMGKFDVSLNSDRQDEFGVLYRGIRKMVEDLESHIERSSHTIAQNKLAQYGALKSQINPHFLANALESIQMKAILSGQRDIGEMVGLLGRLFRLHIRTGKEHVSLKEELEHTRLYIKVQQMRFGDKIRYSEELESGTEDMAVLHFTLQPLIENAIVHGLERKTGPGILRVAAFMEEQTLVITISDDGAGISEDTLESLRRRLKQTGDTLSDDHIGVQNVHDRIRYYYGEGYGLTLDSSPGIGTTITVRVPAARMDKAPAD
ncbi:sensor histidine kinase [Paenibacillus sp. LHD-117]|uniref:cache domain-containing sensor histidine kinase n=1 Tax=Paenibacillus sp. LHD-117 TaxID=3071412 RepID=UPI0027E1872E|nr:sensor histidine kinase [Paenibacillus sp. LHD-117]MDQ6422132.1 sensor histidine kinase [Paenibacillus sp. LHD-117]